eukprot:CAMPEP_0184465842 /NCGR_PEP_ID=MMETSP0740-20130409/63617_1 /TAXON_ID=385413 /ORGANISM="Thalassiosira miniscula, Strain CCMP1093" /LENGTH=34 /DNA_ID= /DNA_START= /DNA_END= /DNA_ORIENTATION=
MTWGWSCNTKLKAEKRLRDALFISTTRVGLMMSM